VSFIIFVIILSALVIVHELGHFLVASINWLPFGGYVKIFGENPSEQTVTSPDSFQSKHRGIQAAVLVAGVSGNFLFAWFLLSLGFVVGLPAPASLALPVENVRTVITSVVPDSPAAIQGLKSGDIIVSLSRGGMSYDLAPRDAAAFISSSAESIHVTIERGREVFTKVVAPKEGIVDGKPAIGVSMDAVGTVKLLPHKAIWHGLGTTVELTVLTAQTIISFISQAIIGKADLSGLTGPVGLVGMVGDMNELGFIYLLTFTALISINLVVINLLPLPALDGGRLLFVGIEAATRRMIPPRIFNALSTASFVLLVVLMFFITVQDIRHIF